MTIKNIKTPLVLAIFILLASCQAQKETGCTATDTPLEVSFGDSTLEDIRFSPFEAGKVWVKVVNQNNPIWEVDNLSGQKVILDEQKSKLFFSDNHNGHLKYCHKDQHDPLIWIGGPNRNVVFYDQRSKVLNELPVKHVTRIVSKPNEVFFVSLQGFCYWDRKTKSIVQVPDIPSEFIRNSVMPDDTTIVLDSKYTYFFNSKQVKKGVFGDNYEREGMYSKNGSIWYVRDGLSKALPLPNGNLDYTKIMDQKYWQADHNFYYSFDPQTEVIKKFHYKLPPVNDYVTDYQVDARHIWIHRPGQVMLIAMADNKQLEFPIAAEEHLLRTLLDECNVYSLYKDKLLIMSKDDFIKRCLPFDADEYDLALKQLNFVIDSLGILKDSVPSSVLSKLNDLKARYSNVNNVEVIRRINELGITAFQGVSYAFPSGYIKCYEDESMPVSQRKFCLKSLVDRYGRSSNFTKVVNLEREFIKHFGAPNQGTDYDFISSVDSVKRYLSRRDSLTKCNLSEDSLFYFKSLALESICQTHWYCGEICNFSLVIDNLKSLPTKFPESQLIDNAMLYVLNADYMLGYEDDKALVSKNSEYERFLRNYPESDLKSDVLFAIFMNWASMETLDHNKIKATARRFIDESASDKRIVEVKQRLKELKIR